MDWFFSSTRISIGIIFLGCRYLSPWCLCNSHRLLWFVNLILRNIRSDEMWQSLAEDLFSLYYFIHVRKNGSQKKTIDEIPMDLDMVWVSHFLLLLVINWIDVYREENDFRRIFYRFVVVFSVFDKNFCHHWYFDRRFTITISSLLLILPLCFSKTIKFLQIPR